MASSGSVRGTFGFRQGVTPVLVLVLLLTASLMAQERAPNRQQALKGCLSATPQGKYQLADDETGILYDLIGALENLRMLVGTDVLVGGHDLEAPEDQGENKGNGNDRSDALSESDDSPAAGHGEPGSRAGTRNFFRVLNAVKVSDLCVLTSLVSATSAASPTR